MCSREHYFPCLKTLDNSTCLLTTLEAKESSNFTFSSDKRNSQDWGRSFPCQFCSKMAAICAFANQIEWPLHKLQMLMPLLARWKSAPRKCRCNSCVFIPSITVLWEWLSCSLERKNGRKEGEEKDWMFILLVDDYHPSLRSLRCVLSDNPYSLSKHKQEMQGTRIWE